MEDLLETGTRCPHCRAAVRPGAPWCTLCHADLRPAPEPAPEPPVAAPALAPPGLDPLTAPAPALGLPGRGEATWPCSTCGAANPIASATCAACGAGFLAGLRESEGPLLELPGLGDLTRMSRAQRVTLAFGVALAFIAIITIIGFLFG